MLLRLSVIFSVVVFISLISGFFLQTKGQSQQAVEEADLESHVVYSDDTLSESNELLEREIVLDANSQNSNKSVVSSVSTPQPTINQPAHLTGLLSMINGYRAQRSMGALQQHDGLCGYARSRQGDIMNGSHGNFMNDNWQSYCPECSYLGENLSYGYSDEKALSEWLNSDAHKVNIEGDWRFGCVSHFPNDTVVLSVGK